MENRKSKFKLILITAILTSILISVLNVIMYFSLKPSLTIVFYETEYVEKQITESYSETYFCSYFRLNSNQNHKINVKDFSLLTNGEWEEAIFVEYFDQIIKTSFETYPNQPTLKVFFRKNDELYDSVIFIKYKDTKMRIGEFVQTK